MYGTQLEMDPRLFSPGFFAKWIDVPLHTVTTGYHLLHIEWVAKKGRSPKVAWCFFFRLEIRMKPVKPRNFNFVGGQFSWGKS